MKFATPTIVYTAASNVEVHLVVELLRGNGIEALAVEDQSGVSLWAFGAISQFHKPNVWIDKSDESKAIELVRQFEESQRSLQRRNKSKGGSELIAICEDCGKESMFPPDQDGTTQECTHCHAYIDVGDLDWEDDFEDASE